MTIFVALLRGINVGGKNKINMAELRNLFESLGFRRVQTYINSGNVLFEATEVEAMQIERSVEDAFGLSVRVVTRTSDELSAIVKACPYQAEVAPNGKNVSIGMMSEEPEKERIDKLAIYKGIDDFQVIGREIHLLARQSVADSKLFNHLPKLSPSVTARNWNTMNKLVELANAME